MSGAQQQQQQQAGYAPRQHLTPEQGDGGKPATRTFVPQLTAARPAGAQTFSSVPGTLPIPGYSLALPGMLYQGSPAAKASVTDRGTPPAALPLPAFAAPPPHQPHHPTPLQQQQQQQQQRSAALQHHPPPPPLMPQSPTRSHHHHHHHHHHHQTRPKSITPGFTSFSGGGGGLLCSHGLDSWADGHDAVAAAAKAAKAGWEQSSEDRAGAHDDEEEQEEHEQVTRQLLAAVLRQEQSKPRHLRHHSWTATALRSSGSANAAAQGTGHEGRGCAAGHAHPWGSHGPGADGSGMAAHGAGPGPSRLSSDVPLSHNSPKRNSQDPASELQPAGEDVGSSAVAQHLASVVLAPRVRSSYHLASGQAALELFLRLSRARQTVDFTRRQHTLFSCGFRARLSVWEALDMLNTLRDYESELLAPLVEQQQQQGRHGHETGHAAAPSTPAPMPTSHPDACGWRGSGHSSDGPALPAAPLSLAAAGTPLLPPAVGVTEWAAGDWLAAPAASESAVGSRCSSSDLCHSLLDHALLCAEACLQWWPDRDYMAVAGLVHRLGMLLSHRQFGSQPPWAVHCLESFPVGCRFSPCIVGSAFFTSNPDRRRRLYGTSVGMYNPGCGLDHVLMSWGSHEYLHAVLERPENNCQLPREARFCVRFHKFFALVRPGSPYGWLLSPEDKAYLPTLRDFMAITNTVQRTRSAGLVEADGTPLTLQEQQQRQQDLRARLEPLVAKYLPPVLVW